jgi:hypothetical protein
VASNFTFWNIFYKYRPLLDPSCWLPPFKGKTSYTWPSAFIIILRGNAGLTSDILLGLFDSEHGDDIFIQNVLTFNGLHGVITQKIVFFMERKV